MMRYMIGVIYMSINWYIFLSCIIAYERIRIDEK
jgi:hypothetical protein